MVETVTNPRPCGSTTTGLTHWQYHATKGIHTSLGQQNSLVGGIKFATAEEAAYPILLCERIVHCFREKALQLGAVAPDTMADQAESATTNAPLSRLVLGALPRGHKVKPLVAEFGDYISVFTDPQRPADLEKFIGTLPKGAKAVARQVITWGDFQSTQLKGGKDVVLNVTALFAVEKVNIGIPSDPEQFIERAIAAGHPRNLDQFVDPQVKSMISDTCKLC